MRFTATMRNTWMSQRHRHQHVLTSAVNAFGQQSTADGVIDFMRAGVIQVFALEIDFRAAQLTRQVLGEI